MAARAFVQFVRRVIGSLDETLVLAIVAAKLLAGATQSGPVAQTRIEIARVTPMPGVIAVAPMAPSIDIAPAAPIAPMAISHLRGDCVRSRTIDIQRSTVGESRITMHVGCAKHGRGGSHTVVVMTTDERRAG